jgi:hypothetical protein
MTTVTVNNKEELLKRLDSYRQALKKLNEEKQS